MRESTSQRWERKQAEEQESLDVHTKEIGYFLGDFNRYIRDMMQANTNDELIRDEINRCTALIDGMWPYHKKNLLVSGKWLETELNITNAIDTFNIRSESNEVDVLCHARSIGFGAQIKNGEYPQLGYLFQIQGTAFRKKIHSNSWGAAIIEYHPLYFAYPENVTLQCVDLHDESEQTLPATDLLEVQAALDLANSQYRLYTQHDSSDFYRLNSNRQEKILRGITEAAALTLPSPVSSVTLRTDADATLLYLANEPGQANFFTEFYPKPGKIIHTEGTVRGVVNLNTVVSHEGKMKHIDSPEDLVNPNIGVCLAVDVADNDKAIYLPYADIHASFGLSIHDK